jgi:hypothetical protein
MLVYDIRVLGVTVVGQVRLVAQGVAGSR